MSPAKRHMALVAAAGCVLGNRGLHECAHQPGAEARTQVHHIIGGNDFATVGLCWGGHQGPGSVHRLGARTFCRIYRPPGETELGLLAWANEDIAKLKVAAQIA